MLHTSLAQIFDELGNNVILRGTPVEIDKDDRRPHLKNEQAYELLIEPWLNTKLPCALLLLALSFISRQTFARPSLTVFVVQ